MSTPDKIISMKVPKTLINDVMAANRPWCFIYINEDGVDGVCSNMDRETSERLIKDMSGAVDRADKTEYTTNQTIPN